MRGGFVGGVFFFTFVISSGINGHSIFSSHYFHPGLHINVPSIRSNPLLISGKFKRDTSSHEDTNTDRQDNLGGRSLSDPVANTGEGLGGLLNVYGSALKNTGSEINGIDSALYSQSSLRTSPALEYPSENENVEDIKYGYTSSTSGDNHVEDESEAERAAYAQAIANAQALSNIGNGVYGTGPTPYAYPSTSTSSALAQALANANSGQIPYSYPSWKSGENEEDNESEAERAAYAKAVANSQGVGNAQTLPGIGNNAYGLGPTPYMYPGPSTSSALAQALANANIRQMPYSYPSWKSGENEEDNESEAERAAYAQAIANAQALSNIGNGVYGIGPTPYAYPSTSTSSALAQALANANSGQIPYSYPSWKSGENEEDNESEAERAAYAKAVANSQGIGNTQTAPGMGNNVYGFGTTHHMYPGPSTFSALAQALANSNVKKRPYSYPSWKSGENEDVNEPEAERGAYAQAIANAQGPANTQTLPGMGNSNYGVRPSLYSSPSSSLYSVLANPGGASPYGYINWRSGDIEENEAERESHQSIAEAELQASIGDNKNEQPDSILASVETVRNLETNPLGNIENIGRYDENPDKELDDDEDSPSSRIAGAYSFANAFAGAVSRVVSQNELIIPNISPGSPQVVQCSRLYEIHVVKSPIYNCMICVCVNELLYLRPICASCNLCQQTPPALQPEIIIPIPSPPPPLPVPQVSCDPLPTESPFQNPLNPCQICICKRTFNVFGQPDVQIQCDDNPQCITQPDIIPIPPIPVPPYVPQPEQVPLCERFPLGVPFPHPIDGCKICKCVAEPFVLEKRIMCIPNPECDLPAPQPIPLPPLPPIEPDPIPRPDLVPVFPPISPPEPQEIVAVPWPPIVPSRPRPRSPLPGPPPHETCRPYPPNTPFQHPWDECQICECVEIRGLNVVNIEVNCYTKPSCCVEPPIPEPLPGPLPLPGPPGPYRHPICEFQSLNVDFINPSDSCKVCTCQIYGNMIVPVCRPTNAIGSPLRNVVYIEPKCRYRKPYQQFLVNCNLCYCEEVFQYVLAKCSPQSNCDAPYLTSLGSGSANALAQASANAQSQDYLLGMGDQLTSTAVAQANSDSYLLGAPSSSSSAEAYANALANTGNEYPYAGLNDYSSAVAQANSQSGISPYLNSYPYSLGGSQSSAQAQAEAIANSQSSLRPLEQYIDLSPYGNVYPYSSLGGSQSSAQAQAEALANAQSNAYPNIYQYYPGDALSSSQAQVEAIANAESGGWYSNPYTNYPYYPGNSQASSQAEAQAIAASQLYPNLYPSPGTNVLPLYQPGTNYWDGLSQGQSYSQALAQSSANAQGLGQSDALSQALAQGSASAQSLAQASAISGRPLIKSGPGLCQYDGDKYHHNCQACFCFRENTGSDGDEDDSSTSEE